MFAQRLRSLRQERGFASQQDLADALGVAQSTVANWEGGRREPNYALTVKLADLFRVTLDYLLGRSDEPNGGVVTDQQVRSAVWGARSGLTDEVENELWEDVQEYARYRLQHYRRR